MVECIILCIDDDMTVLSALRTLLVKQLGPGHLVEIAESGEEALEIEAEARQRGSELGVVICDFIMPGMRGDELLVQMHAVSPRTVNIMLTGQSDLKGIQRATNEANLYQFIEKPFSNDELVRVARAGVALFAARTGLQAGSDQLRASNAELVNRAATCAMQLAQAEQALRQLARQDQLTGVFNRITLSAILQDALTLCQAEHRPLAVMVVRLENLRDINDSAGYGTGDAALCALARAVTAQLQPEWQTGRWSGAQLLVMAPGAGAAELAALAGQLQCMAWPAGPVPMLQCGIAEISGTEGVDGLVRRARNGLPQRLDTF